MGHGYIQKSENRGKSRKYAYVWANGAHFGEPWELARKYLKQKQLLLGLKKVNGQLFYFLKFRGSNTWIRCRAITDTGDFKVNRRIALEDYFHNGIRLQQAREGFKIIKLK